MVTVRRSPELEALAEEARQRFRNGDNDWFAATTAHGEVIAYGSAPEEVWRGRDAVLDLTVEHIRTLNESAGLVADENADVETEGYETGDTGWIVTHGHFRLKDGSTVPTRSISVCVRDDDGWKFVLSGVDVVVPNELIAPGSPLVTREAAPA
jgi:hypothetical protein